jgi:thiamine-phosphate pyrophosphorylase
MLLYAITQRSLFSGTEEDRAKSLLAQARKLATGGVHYLQIREKDLSLSALGALAASIVTAVHSEGSSMRVLLNGPAAVAMETNCDGIHLSSDSPENAALAARRLYRQRGRDCTISAACHTLNEVRERRGYADLLLFSPVFEKIEPQRIIHGVGLSALSQAVTTAQGVPVFALGGVTVQNAHACTAAGAAGIAAIRLFYGEGWKAIAPHLPTSRRSSD